VKFDDWEQIISQKKILTDLANNEIFQPNSKVFKHA